MRLPDSTLSFIGWYVKFEYVLKLLRSRTDPKRSISTVDGKASVSNIFSVIFPSFVYLLATKPMAKWYRASEESSGGLWVENKAEI